MTTERTNDVPVDRFVMAHAGIGMWMGALRIKEPYAIVIAIGWEVFENFLKKAVPQVFPDSKPDILSNAVIDAIGMYAGYKLTRMIFK